jgi:diguanylate cyclase
VHHSNLIELDLRGDATPPVACQPTCPELTRRTNQLEQQRVEDLASVVGALHEALAALGEEMSSWQGEVQTSAARFGAIVSQPDPAVLRTQVLDEVRALKKVVVDRRQRWDVTKRAYAERVTTLEVQLRTTREEAATDGLTGLANRRAFDRELAHRLRSSQQRVVLALFDVDNFKGVNDTMGHAEGDRLLTAIAGMLTTSMRPGDLVARLGGDEFAVIVAGLTLGQTECRFATLVSEIGVALHGVSCGLSEYSAGDNAQSLYDRADGALYDAKRDGKHRVATRSQRYLKDH